MDNNLNDQTREVVEEACRRCPGRFRYQLEPRQGTSHTLNTGIAGATGDVLAFMDNDVEVEPDWLLDMVAPFRNAGVVRVRVGVFYPEVPSSLPQLAGS